MRGILYVSFSVVLLLIIMSLLLGLLLLLRDILTNLKTFLPWALIVGGPVGFLAAAFLPLSAAVLTGLVVGGVAGAYGVATK